MNQYTVEIETGSDDDLWQAVSPAENGVGDSPHELAAWTAANQTVADGPWRVNVWDGHDQDTSSDPMYRLYSNES